MKEVVRIGGHRHGALGLALSLGLSAAPAYAQNTRTPLSQGWDFRDASWSEWWPAAVPGTVHTDLLANDRIPDPFVGAVEAGLQWIEQSDWEYRVLVQPKTGSARSELLFEGLDTYADVFLDGMLLLRADNMFRSWRADVTRALGDGKPHELRILFRSPIAIEDSLSAAYPQKLPAGNDPHGTRVFTRKAAYHYGWDWGARYVTAGVWRPVTLHQWTGATVRDAFIRQDSLSDARAALHALLNVELDAPADVTIAVRSPTNQFAAAKLTKRLARGRNDVALPLEILRPRRWWPNGLGEPYLYDAVIEVQLAGRVVDSVTKHFGLRTLRLVQQPDSIGRSFYFEVNGAPVFMKGANTIPLDHFTPRVDSARYARMFQDVQRANMNMLRIWGGGIYETDLFYDLADRHGILLWQDFMFANGMYPGDPKFIASVRAEAEDQVTRLRQHPSLALWCGNNEIWEGWRNWGWQNELGYTLVDSAAVEAAYHRLFDETLPAVTRALDPQRPYWPSSPSIGWGHAESLTEGDSHYWGVWWGEEPFEVYLRKLPRFSSEYGFQAYPALASIERFTQPEDRRVGSAVMLAHQKHARGDELIRTYMARSYTPPRDFAEFVYQSQLLQADGIGMAIEAHRRAMPRTMGTLYWQLGDTWPVVSWSGIDWYGEWKALHFAAMRAFAPVLVSPVIEGDVIRVQLVSDRRTPAAGTLTVRTLRFTGEETFRTQQPVTLAANTSTTALQLPVADAIIGNDAAHAVLVAELALDDGTRARHLLYFAPPKDLELPDPGLNTTTSRIGDEWIVQVHAQNLARGVQLQSAGARFEDNYFDLLPGETRSIRVQAGAAPAVTARALTGKVGSR